MSSTVEVHEMVAHPLVDPGVEVLDTVSETAVVTDTSYYLASLLTKNTGRKSVNFFI